MLIKHCCVVRVRCTNYSWNLDLKDRTKTSPLPPRREVMQIAFFQSGSLCVRIDWGWWGGSYPFTLYGCRPQWSCPPPTPTSAEPPTPTHTPHNGVRSPYTGNFSPCPWAPLPLSGHGMARSSQGSMTKLAPYEVQVMCTSSRKGAPGLQSMLLSSHSKRLKSVHTETVPTQCDKPSKSLGAFEKKNPMNPKFVPKPLRRNYTHWLIKIAR